MMKLGAIVTLFTALCVVGCEPAKPPTPPAATEKEKAAEKTPDKAPEAPKEKDGK